MRRRCEKPARPYPGRHRSLDSSRRIARNNYNGRRLVCSLIRPAALRLLASPALGRWAEVKRTTHMSCQAGPVAPCGSGSAAASHLDSHTGPACFSADCFVRGTTGYRPTAAPTSSRPAQQARRSASRAEKIRAIAKILDRLTRAWCGFRAADLHKFGDVTSTYSSDRGQRFVCIDADVRPRDLVAGRSDADRDGEI